MSPHSIVVLEHVAELDVDAALLGAGDVGRLQVVAPGDRIGQQRQQATVAGAEVDDGRVAAAPGGVTHELRSEVQAVLVDRLVDVRGAVAVGVPLGRGTLRHGARLEQLPFGHQFALQI
jgi:hypothetical protein